MHRASSPTPVEATFATACFGMVTIHRLNSGGDEVIRLRAGQNVVLGRHPTECDATFFMKIDSKRVSRVHARICYDGRQATVEDCSSNGTFLNGMRIDAKSPLCCSRAVM